MKKGSAPGIPFRGYVCVDSLRPDDSLTILSMASSIGSRDSVSFLLTIQATGLLTFTLVGLSPTEIRQPSLDTPTRRFIPTLSGCAVIQPESAHGALNSKSRAFQPQLSKGPRFTGIVSPP